MNKNYNLILKKEKKVKDININKVIDNLISEDL